MHRPGVTYRGTLHRFVLDSEVLNNNPLGDPAAREVFVYLPAQPAAGLPLLVDLPGFNSAGPDHVARRNIGENVPERLDRLIGSGAMPPAVVAFPDCMTSLGGNQYINSAGTGQFDAHRWDAWLAHDPVRAPENCLRNLEKLAMLWIDCGARDQYFLNLGARQFSRRLAQLGIAHVYEEYPDEHLDVDYRMDRFLPALALALST
jgi:hypothetical protein